MSKKFNGKSGERHKMVGHMQKQPTKNEELLYNVVMDLQRTQRMVDALQNLCFALAIKTSTSAKDIVEAMNTEAALKAMAININSEQEKWNELSKKAEIQAVADKELLTEDLDGLKQDDSGGRSAPTES